MVRVISFLPVFCFLPLVLMGAGCSEPVEPPEAGAKRQPAGIDAGHPEQQRLGEFFQDYFDRELRRNPLSASYVGRETDKGQWNSVAEAFQSESRALLEADLETITGFDPALLTDAQRLSLQLFQRDGERQLLRDDFRHEAYVMHQFRGPHTRVPSALINVHQIRDVADAEAYIQRIENVPDYFDGVIEQLNLRAQRGLLLVDWMYPQMIRAAGNVVSGVPFDDAGEDSTIWKDFTSKIANLEVESAEKERLRQSARLALRESLEPAYRRLIATLERQAEAATGDDGVWRFERGEAYYQMLLNWYTTTSLSAEEIHALGLENIARIHSDMREVMKTVGFEGDLQAFFVAVRDNPDLRYPNSDQGRAQYLQAAESAVAAMKTRLPDYFGRVPKAELVIKRVEPFRERSAGKAFYQGPPIDGSRPGIYYANLYDMGAMPKTDIEALAFHEGVPGHHLQRALTTELTEIPDFQRYLSFTAFTEGWGLYSEYLAKEMGFYTDPYSEFGRLAMELWRAARLVVDTGLHHKRWSREQAIDFLVTNTPNARSDCVKAIERYIAMPGQATAYMIGKIRILELREAAREALGDRFDIREFHDTVLSSGPIPLDVLQQRVSELVVRTLNGGSS